MLTFRDDVLDGQVALITGGGTGIGLGIARAFAGAGCAVVLASRSREHLDPAVDALTAAGARAAAVPTNVRDPEAVSATVAEAVDRFGRLDILVNNAAGNFYAPSHELTPNGWRAVVETDLYGTFFCCQAVYPVMRDQGRGRILSISMTLHHRGWPGMAHATAAKAGVDALTRTLALEWAADGITVNAIAPGPIPTPGATAAFAEGAEPGKAVSEDMRRKIPAGRWGAPEDVAGMALYLASPAADWITGAIMVVDGGSSLAS